MREQMCQAVTTSYESRWPHHYHCGKKAKAVMVGRKDHFGSRENGEPEEIHLCGIHAAHARKGRALNIADVPYRPTSTGPASTRYAFEATPLEALKDELASLNSKYGDAFNRPTTQYRTIGETIYRNADALEAIIAALPMEEAQKLMLAVEQTDAALRYDENKQARKAELERLIAEAKERGEQ